MNRLYFGIFITMVLPLMIQSMDEKLRLCVEQVTERTKSDESIGKTQLTTAIQTLQNHIRVFVSSSQFKKDYRYAPANDLYQELKCQRELLRQESLITESDVISVAQVVLEKLNAYEKNSSRWTACIESKEFEKLKNVCRQTSQSYKS